MDPTLRGALVALAESMAQAQREEAQERAAAMREMGTEIRTRREAKQMTLRALAEALEVSAPFLSDVEHGRRRLSVEKAAMADAILGGPS